jgi:transcriptional antiterminator NusG
MDFAETEVVIDEITPEEIEELINKNWYVVYTYSGIENKVKDNIVSLAEKKNYSNVLKKVFIPIENLIEIKKGKKVLTARKIFPGYVLVQIDELSDELVLDIKSISGVADFVREGLDSDQNPLPLPKEEIRNLLKKAIDSPTKPKTQFDIGDNVMISSGPFLDFVGVVDEVDIDKGKLKVMLDIFGRKTSVELNFDQVEKQIIK